MRALMVSFLAAAVSLTAAMPAKAEISGAKVVVDGVGCPFCVYGLEKKLEEVKGVEDVKFNLKSGVATLALDGKDVPRAADIRSAVRKAGFTPRKIELTAIGRVISEARKVLLAVRGSDQKFILFEEAAGDAYLREETRKILGRRDKDGATVAVTGSFHAHEEGPSGLAAEKVEEVHAVRLGIQGMKCKDCAERVEKVLERVEGVYRATIDLEKKEGQVESIGKPLGASGLISALKEAGFSASVIEGTTRR